MDSKLILYNTLTRPETGIRAATSTLRRVVRMMRSDGLRGSHLGHARPAITFDLLFRYLRATGYKVRYVRNITDVGHLENDADSGEDKIAKKARLEELESRWRSPKYYTNRYHEAMQRLNDTSRRASSRTHRDTSSKQIAMIEKILEQRLRLRKQRLGLFRRRGI